MRHVDLVRAAAAEEQGRGFDRPDHPADIRISQRRGTERAVVQQLGRDARDPDRDNRPEQRVFRRSGYQLP
jgi:hypothetical protein